MNLPEEVLSKDEYRWQNCCDVCGFAAAYAACLNDSMLLFCNHHFTNNSAALLESGWLFIDRAEQAVDDERVSV